MTLGERIKSLRKAQGLSQKELAQRMYVERSTITRYETRSDSVTLATLERIADALGVPVTRLLEDGIPERDRQVYAVLTSYSLGTLTAEQAMREIYKAFTGVEP